MRLDPTNCAVNQSDRLIGIMDRIGFDEYDLRKSLFFTSHKSQLTFIEKELAARRQAGFDVSFLSKNEIHENYGMAAEYAILSEKVATIDAYAFDSCSAATQQG